MPGGLARIPDFRYKSPQENRFRRRAVRIRARGGGSLGKTITNMKPYIYSIAFGTTLACAIGCATNSADKSAAAKPDGKVRPQAVAVLSPAPNGKVKGQVTFQEATEGVRVIANIEGLTPGKHGLSELLPHQTKR